MNVAVDIGGTMIKSGIWDGAFLTDIREYPTEARGGGTSLMEQTKRILHEYIQTGKKIEAIGVSTAGQVDPVRGSIIYANENLPGYTGTEVRRILEKAFSLPVAVENDVNAAALGELHCGAGRGFEDFLCLTYGTGVGGAIVTDGKLYRGSTNSAGEFGAMVIHPEQRRAKDPFSGCYEQCASVTALVKKVCAVNPEFDSGKKIFAQLNDPSIKAIIDVWINEIVYGLLSLIHIFNPSCIILGGGVMEQEYVLHSAEALVRSQIMESFRGVEIRKAQLGNQAGMMGAAWLAGQMTKG